MSSRTQLWTLLTNRIGEWVSPDDILFVGGPDATATMRGIVRSLKDSTTYQLEERRNQHRQTEYRLTPLAEESSEERNRRMAWRCNVCGNPPGSMPQTTMDLRWRMGNCRHCHNPKAIYEEVVSRRGDDDRGQARHTDPATSKAAAMTVRTGSAKMALLLAHFRHPDGLTDEEAARVAGLSLTSEYATRCSELMRAGLIESTKVTRIGQAGMAREVRRITQAGMDKAVEW